MLCLRPALPFGRGRFVAKDEPVANISTVRSDNGSERHDLPLFNLDGLRSEIHRYLWRCNSLCYLNCFSNATANLPDGPSRPFADIDISQIGFRRSVLMLRL